MAYLAIFLQQAVCWRKLRKEGTSSSPSIAKQELNLLVLTVRTIPQDHIVLSSVRQTVRLPARSMKSFIHEKKPKPKQKKQGGQEISATMHISSSGH